MDFLNLLPKIFIFIFVYTIIGVFFIERYYKKQPMKKINPFKQFLIFMLTLFFIPVIFNYDRYSK